MSVRAMLFTLSILSLVPAAAAGSETGTDERVLEAMHAGGVVLLFRHAQTESGIGDPPEFRLGDCSTQRNLSQAGRQQSLRLGERLRALGVDVAEVRSSRWCRCIDTAELAFGGYVDVRPWAPLDSFFGGQGDREAQTREALAGLSALPDDRVWVWVTHQVNVSALTGEYTSMGDAIVARPRDGSLEVIGRWRP